ncbi:DUF2325 domain-containing protein [Paraburkholderia tropica]|uniref:DUF2325 domain-containing protein n=1 Tax=Paraburkholderia tropica TaxID=92647 RepID=UPI000A62ADF5|nr:DUF2325 domain-containing protein [Paraburkholderia tropica]MBB2981858.1 hypothetical protein [Paraburkholderia tropica]
MTATDLNWVRLCDEHGRVVRELGRAQRRASAVIDAQAQRIAALEAQAMRLRAAVVIRETALAWTRDELHDVKTAIAGLPKRLALAQQVRVLEARVHALMRRSPEAKRAPVAASNASSASNASNASNAASEPRTAAPPTERRRVVMWIAQDREAAQHADETARTERALAESGVRLVRTNAASAEQLKAGLADADLVICQAGCVSHGDWWRVKDYCARTGKQCILVEHPDALERVTASRNTASVDSAD